MYLFVYIVLSELMKLKEWTSIGNSRGVLYVWTKWFVESMSASRHDYKVQVAVAIFDNLLYTVVKYRET